MGGNASKKLAAQCDMLTRDEQKYIAQTFRSASRNSDKIKEDDLIVSGKLDRELLERYWGPMIDPRLAQFITNYLFGYGGSKQGTCDFNRFAQLYVVNVRGMPEERCDEMNTCLAQAPGSDTPFAALKEFCEALASTYIKVLKNDNATTTRGWTEKGFSSKAARVQALGEAIASSVAHDGDSVPSSISPAMLSNWIMNETLLRTVVESVFVALYGVGESLPPALNLLPEPEGLDSMPDYPAFADLAHVLYLNAHVPRAHAHKWRFLFSSHIHGQSFSTMAGRIMDQGPSVVIIEDSNGYMFGGYASHAWNISPNFYGSEESFLFTLAPKMRVYHGCTFNNHYQYFNFGTKTLPNGLLMGGQFEYGGLWIPAEPFGIGASAETCSTYRGFKRLSKEKEFKIRSIEVWGVGDKPLTVRDSDERDTSCLDFNPEAKAILELTGKSRHSEGLREPPPGAY